MKSLKTNILLVPYLENTKLYCVVLESLDNVFRTTQDFPGHFPFGLIVVLCPLVRRRLPLQLRAEKKPNTLTPNLTSPPHKEHIMASVDWVVFTLWHPPASPPLVLAGHRCLFEPRTACFLSVYPRPAAWLRLSLWAEMKASGSDVYIWTRGRPLRAGPDKTTLPSSLGPPCSPSSIHLFILHSFQSNPPGPLSPPQVRSVQIIEYGLWIQPL